MQSRKDRLGKNEDMDALPVLDMDKAEDDKMQQEVYDPILAFFH